MFVNGRSLNASRSRGRSDIIGLRVSARLRQVTHLETIDLRAVPNPRVREDIPTTPIELRVQSAGVSEEEQIFYTEDDDETQEQILQRKKEARTTQQIKYTFEKFTIHKRDYHNFSTFQKLSHENSIPIEQKNDVILQQLRLKKLKQNSETILP